MITMPPKEILLRLAQKAKERAAKDTTCIGPDSTAERWNEIGNQYLIALTQAERELDAQS